MSLTIVILAAGRATRYGRLKQLDAVGPRGACLMDYGIVDAARAGFDRFVLVVPPGLEHAFAEHAQQQFGDRLDLRLVSQRLDDLPDGHRAPPERTKPWGTAHAVLAAGSLVDGPFAVANADDFYGRSAYAALVTHAAEHPDEAALVGYELATTLSAHGGVSRGICETDAEGRLIALIEAKEVRRSDGAIRGVTVDGRPLTLRGTEPASMNIWGFPRDVLALVHREWLAFLGRHGGDPVAEFLLSSTVNDLVTSGEIHLSVLPTDARWFGMTFSDDAPVVRRRIAELVASGEYPEHLREGLS